MDCILEDTVASPAGRPATAAARVTGRRGSRIPSGSRGNSRRGSSTDMQDTAAVAANLIDSMDSTSSGGIADKANMFSYWLQVSVSPQVCIFVYRHSSISVVFNLNKCAGHKCLNPCPRSINQTNNISFE